LKDGIGRGGVLDTHDLRSQGRPHCVYYCDIEHGRLKDFGGLKSIVIYTAMNAFCKTNGIGRKMINKKKISAIKHILCIIDSSFMKNFKYLLIFIYQISKNKDRGLDKVNHK
jgi:hypothetical protein